MIFSGSSEMKSQLEAAFDLEPSAAMFKETEHLYQRANRVIPEADWLARAPYIKAINDLKAEKDAVVLAHNYMTPDIYHGVADIVGDSLQLAIEATKVKQSTIIQGGVHFMAETSKILSPEKTVLIPDRKAGCSLAESITAADIEMMRAQYPGAKVVSYVNTTAEVKAASDICCTSSNAAKIVDAQEGDLVIMTPDGHLAQNVAKQTKKKIVYWEGACMVHIEFKADELREYRKYEPDALIIGHPECPTDVIDECDFSGSTAGMIDYVRKNKPEKVLLITECSMGSNIANEVPEVNFLGPCNLCPHMQKITLENILWSLHTGEGAVEVEEKLAAKARLAVQRMIDLK
ncbi:quinolinate synthase A [Amylibacter marinus]|uniref:Quinolinate synthase n=1 Tax=Amylibacter marinus TaxID=1475483 RepID=A0ABQ5VWM9_9RHOB|nr:quinolinate synthase NadA [Amylibacter marinus]GLQ35609.1 quinolinate synthase A [Amylibacter marinus]